MVDLLKTITRDVDDNNYVTVYTVMDENGCSTDPQIFQDWDYDPVKQPFSSITV